MDMEGGRGDAPLVLGFAQPPPPLITNLCFPPHGRVAGVVVSHLLQSTSGTPSAPPSPSCLQAWHLSLS